MPGIIGWATPRRSKHLILLQWDSPSLIVKGSAPKFSKRTILTGPGLFLVGFLFFHTPGVRNDLIPLPLEV
jgi:hypothetical protein